MFAETLLPHTFFDLCEHDKKKAIHNAFWYDVLKSSSPALDHKFTPKQADELIEVMESHQKRFESFIRDLEKFKELYAKGDEYACGALVNMNCDMLQSVHNMGDLVAKTAQHKPEPESKSNL